MTATKTDTTKTRKPVATRDTGKLVTSWLSAETTANLLGAARRSQRSVSSLVRDALDERYGNGGRS